MPKYFYKLFILILIGILSVSIYWFSPYKIECYGYYNKIWAHRANTVKKANAALKYYDGIELDLVYLEATNILDVNHPPAKSLNLSFEDYLLELPLENSPYLWLDIKNLNAKNAYLILSRLEKVLKQYDYDFSKVLIETVNPEALPIFNRKGFITSYYLPYGLSLRKEKDLKETLKVINRAIQFQPELALSSDYQDYDVIAKNFPERKKYFWAIERPINLKYKAIRHVLKDTTVKAVLLNYRILDL